MSRQLIFIIFFLASTVYLFLGMYSYMINRKGIKNRVFFVMSICFVMWTLSISAVSMSTSIPEITVWSKIGLIGWGLLFSTLVHLGLIMAERQKILNNKLTYLFIYGPSVIYIAGNLTLGLNVEQVYLTSDVWELWRNVPYRFIPLYNFYYSLFSVASFLLMMYWKNNGEPLSRRSKIILTVSILTNVIAGAFADAFLMYRDCQGVPHFAGIYAMIPVIAVFIVMKKGGWLKASGRNDGASAYILNDAMRLKFTRYVGIAIISGGYLNVLHIFIAPEISGKILLTSLFLTLSGLFVRHIPYLIFSRENQDYVIAAILTILSAAVVIRFTPIYAGNIVWPAAMIFMLAAVLFDNKKIIVVIGCVNIAAVLTGAYIFPAAVVSVTVIDYISRATIYFTAFLIAIFVNKVFLMRINENNEQVSFQKMIYDISTGFISVNKSTFGDNVNKVIETVGRYYSLRSVNFTLIDFFDKKIVDKNNWHKYNTTEDIDEFIDEYILKNNEIYLSLVNRETVVLISDKIDHSERYERIDYGSDVKSVFYDLPKSGSESVLIIPVIINTYVKGFMMFGNIDMSYDHYKKNIEQLKVVVSILASSLERIESQNEKNRLAFFDYLTQLPNRRSFNVYLKNAMNEARKKNVSLGAILIDLDGFKEVNDSLGHELGDYVIIEVANRLKEYMEINGHGYVARFGGDEFLIVVDNIDSDDDVVRTASGIMDKFEVPVRINDHEFFITSSAGIAYYPTDGETVEEIIKNADLAMYSAKNNGKNQFAVCNVEMKMAVLNNMKMTNSLHRSIDNDELFLYYQPQYDIKTNELVGFEALLRWENKSLGRVDTSKFIQLAEDNGLIRSIGEWVLLEACRQNKKWQDMGYKCVKVSVNISVNQFHSGDFSQSVIDALRESGLFPEYLELEITEGVIIRNPEYVIKTLNEIKRMGVKISIDDFGTEYSSLSRLKLLPADRIKIDIMFTRGINHNTKDREIIEVIIRLARDLRLQVVAEGVETASQLKFLQIAGCNYYQGFYGKKPLSTLEIEDYFGRL